MDIQNQPTTIKCPFCAEDILSNEINCRHCGELLNKQATESIPSVPTKQGFSNAQPVWQFVILSILSFGLYEIYWFYKNWKSIKEHEKLDISPFWRAFFTVIFAYSLFEKVRVLAKEKGSTENFSSALLTVIFVALTLLSRLPEPYMWISIFSVGPLIFVQKALNYYWQQEQTHLQTRTKLSRNEIVLIIIGGIILILILIFYIQPFDEDTSTAIKFTNVDLSPSSKQETQHYGSYIYNQEDINDLDADVRLLAGDTEMQNLLFERYSIPKGTTRLVMFTPYANTVISIARENEKNNYYSISDIKTMLNYDSIYTTANNLPTSEPYSIQNLTDIDALLEYDGGKTCRGSVDTVTSKNNEYDGTNWDYETSISATFNCYSEVYLKEVKYIYTAGNSEFSYIVDMSKYK
ncbi:MAG: hypothetical protein Q7J35_18310 [Candidatus Methanoperedens sp.]|nr:hypothetical protein [Candidatus Methanoperedens sp.]